MENGDAVSFLQRFFQIFTRPKANLWIQTEKDEFSLGDELKGIVGFASEEEFDVEEIVVRLSCWESVKKTRRHYQAGHYETNKITGEKEWVPDKEWFENYWDTGVLYSKSLQVCSQTHVSVGFNIGFPFAFEIPKSGRETFQGVDRTVRWFLTANMRVKGRRSIKVSKEILVSKPSVLVKEIVREVVLIPCSYCGGLIPQTSTFCPHCGAKRKG